MGKQESLSDYYEMAKYEAKAERELKVESWFHVDGLCELHDAGLKPTEGKLSHHSIRIDNFKASKSISWNVAKEWLNEENVECIVKICEAFQ